MMMLITLDKEDIKKNIEGTDRRNRPGSIS